MENQPPGNARFFKTEFSDSPSDGTEVPYFPNFLRTICYRTKEDDPMCGSGTCTSTTKVVKAGERRKKLNPVTCEEESDSDESAVDIKATIPINEEVETIDYLALPNCFDMKKLIPDGPNKEHAIKDMLYSLYLAQKGTQD